MQKVASENLFIIKKKKNVKVSKMHGKPILALKKTPEH